MIRNENRVEISRSPADVFAFVADLCNEPKYVPNVVETEKISDGPCGVGSKYREVTRVMFGRNAVATYEITQYDPPTTFAFRGTSGRSTFRGRWVIEATDGGSLAKFTAEAKLAWPMKYMERVIRGSVAATFAVMGRNLERMLRPVPEAGKKTRKVAAAATADASVDAAKSARTVPAKRRREPGAATTTPSRTQTPGKRQSQGQSRLQRGGVDQSAGTPPAAKRSTRKRGPSAPRKPSSSPNEDSTPTNDDTSSTTGSADQTTG